MGQNIKGKSDDIFGIIICKVWIDQEQKLYTELMKDPPKLM